MFEMKVLRKEFEPKKDEVHEQLGPQWFV